MANVTIRMATRGDLQAINDIYNHYVATSPCTFHTEPVPIEERQAWFEKRTDRHPVIVAVNEGMVIGWASMSPYRERPAYNNTVENSVYVHHEHHGKGVGRLLMTSLIELGIDRGYHTILAGATSSETASIRLHESLGFVKVAHLREVGFKFNRWHDVVFLQRMLP